MSLRSKWWRGLRCPGCGCAAGGGPTFSPCVMKREGSGCWPVIDMYGTVRAATRSRCRQAKIPRSRANERASSRPNNRGRHGCLLKVLVPRQLNAAAAGRLLGELAGRALRLAVRCERLRCRRVAHCLLVGRASRASSTGCPVVGVRCRRPAHSDLGDERHVLGSRHTEDTNAQADGGDADNASVRHAVVRRPGDLDEA